MVAGALLSKNDLLGAVVNEDDWTGNSLLLLKHEGREHAQLLAADHVNLQILEIGIKDELTFSDGSFIGVPNEGVVDNASLRID